MSVICPCRGCEDRTPECHGKCEPYLAWKAARTEGAERMNREAKARHVLADGYARRATSYSHDTKKRVRIAGFKHGR